VDLFIFVTLNGLTLAALYFIVASGFTLIFGVMRTINLAHGTLYLLGAYIGYDVAATSGNWYLGVLAATLAVALVGVVIQNVFLGWMQGQELRQTLVTIGLSLVMADLMLAYWGGLTYRFDAPQAISGFVSLPVGPPGYAQFRLVLIALAVVVGAALWLLLHRTKLGIMIRAGVDDRDMVAALGINVPVLFTIVFALGAGLAGLAGVIGGTALSFSPGDDMHYLLTSLIVVIVGGMGSVGGAALGALLIGLAEQYGLTYTPTYGVLYTFLIMVAVLAFRPQGLMGRKA
jgi:branched-chain amino acid transport system permease protein